MKVIGLSGTNGSGKDTVGEILEKNHGFLFVSITDILRNELRKQKKPVSRENMRALGNQWRREIGLAVLVNKAVEVYKTEKAKYKGLVVASIRNLGEVEQIHSLGGVMVWVDADTEVRYQRVTGRGRSSEDAKTYEEFLREEQDEMESSGDDATLAMAEVKKLCDVFIENNSDSSEILKATTEHALREYL